MGESPRVAHAPSRVVSGALAAPQTHLPRQRQKLGAKSSDLPGYDRWAREQVSLELGRAGYRLAAILKKVWP